MDYHNWLGTEAHRAATEGHRAMMRDQCANSFFLYYKRGGLAVAIDSPGPGWTLAAPERVSQALTADQIGRWVLKVARQLPCLPAE